MTASADPPLKLTVTGDAVFASNTLIMTRALDDTGMLVVAWMAFGAPAPASEAMMKENGNGRISDHEPAPEAPDFR
ncbi:hypothetical protein CN126_12390 [Sinorhizobium meliloti]|nr:hypothetical protein CN126_12390 [Sinorhizobium meliloti]